MRPAPVGPVADSDPRPRSRLRPSGRMVRCHGGERGEIVEAVVVFPVFLLLVLLMFQFAFVMLGHEDAQAASQYGVQVAATSGDPQAGVAASQQLLSTLGGSMLSAHGTTDAGTTPGVASVTSTVTVQGIVPLPGIELSTSSTSVAAVQALSPAGR